MFSAQQVDWRRTFQHWNVIWVQMTLLLFFTYTALFWVWAFPNVFNMISCLWKAGASAGSGE